MDTKKIMRFATVYFDICAAFHITPMECLYLSVIRNLSSQQRYDFWCVASNIQFADILCVSVRTIQVMSDRLEKAEYMVRGEGTRKRLTERMNDAFLWESNRGAESAPVQNLHGGGAESARGGAQNLHSRGAESAPNKEKIYKEDKESIYNSAQSAFEKTEKKKPGRKKKEAAEQIFESDPFEDIQGEKDVRRKSLYQDFCAAYDQFHEEQSGMKLNFKDGKTQKGISGIWEALKGMAKNQQDREQGALDSFVFIAKKWATLSPFLQSQIQPMQMLASLPNIRQVITGNVQKTGPGKANGNRRYNFEQQAAQKAEIEDPFADCAIKY